MTPSELLKAYGLPAKKRFGQNFLIDPEALDSVIRSAMLPAGATVLEIGPGPGGLSSRLLAHGFTVRAIETDTDLVAHLEATLGPHEAFSVLAGDALKQDIDAELAKCAGVVANLPYNVATPILFRLLDSPEAPPTMALMFQKEVADRIVCTGPARQFSSLGVACNIRYDTTIAMKLKPGAFRPSPKVHSAVVRFTRRETPRCSAEVETLARSIAREAFLYRRKMLRKTLLPCIPDPIATLSALGFTATARPEELSVDDFIRLASHQLAAG
ncbi:MAG: 16S rRNA (adenine1518-N6/adenine1519-N6)-dimethyltransferase [Bradymonadia bacterium]|jgi:16S rRNA (adenine1518-N6/adenine1519-N6)-dimethyltransferase